MIVSIYDTKIMNSIDTKSYIKHIVDFIVNNRGTFTINEKIKEGLKAEPMLKTIISDIYRNIVNEGKLNIFSFMDFTHKASIPEGFLTTYWNLDLLQIKDFMKDQYRVLSSFPEINDKILYNITNTINAKQDKITDLSKFQQIVIRDFLTRSYYETNDNWLSPNIIYYLTKFYSIVLSTSISRTYNLSYDEQMYIATILSIYFMQKCHNKSSFNPLLNRLDFLSRMVNIKEVTLLIESEYKGKELTIENICSVIRKTGSSRLASFNESTFYKLGMSTNPNQLISLISLEYPPYWFYSVLLAMSGMKTNLYHSFKNLNLKNDAIAFTKEILSSKHLVGSVMGF